MEVQRKRSCRLPPGTRAARYGTPRRSCRAGRTPHHHQRRNRSAGLRNFSSGTRWEDSRSAATGRRRTAHRRRADAAPCTSRKASCGIPGSSYKMCRDRPVTSLARHSSTRGRWSRELAGCSLHPPHRRVSMPRARGPQSASSCVQDGSCCPPFFIPVERQPTKRVHLPGPIHQGLSPCRRSSPAGSFSPFPPATW